MSVEQVLCATGQHREMLDQVLPASACGRPTTSPSYAPRPDHLAMSWFALREWAGLLAQRMGF